MNSAASGGTLRMNVKGRTEKGRIVGKVKKRRILSSG